MTEPQVHTRTTQHVVSSLPEESINHQSWAITVEYRGRERWAVLRGRQCLGRDGTWDWESIPSEREDEWIDGHRFTEEEALRLAQEWAPKVMVNGMTAADVLTREARRDG